MPPEDLARFLFNKDEHNKERYCLACKTLYRCVCVYVFVYYRGGLRDRTRLQHQQQS